MNKTDYVPLMDRYSNEKFKEIVQNNNSFKSVMSALGYSSSSGDSKTQLLKKIESLEIDISHFNNKNRKKLSDEDIFKEDSLVDQHSLRKHYSKKYPPNKCSICGQESFWNGKPLTLILDHINGKNHDNRFNNLRWVCPNCNMQLPTTNRRKNSFGKKYNYCMDCGKKISSRSLRCVDCVKKYKQDAAQESKPITREELKALIREKSFVSIGKQFNVSDNAIRKWCKVFNLPSSSRQIKKINDEDWKKI